MIKTFASKETEKLFQRKASRVLPLDIQRTGLDIRFESFFPVAFEIRCMKPPGIQLERLSGERESQYGIRIDQQWWICFQWENGNYYDVEIVDHC